MSEITPNDLPPINELDEFTSHIPELQIDTDVLAGTDGPANFQAQALANRTKYLKRILDAVSLELNGINQAVATAQQVADTAKQGADASMKKSANGADIVNPAAFRENIGLSNAMFKGEFGWGGKAINVGSGVNLFDYFTRERAAGLYWVNQTGINRPPNFADCVLIWNPIEHADFYGCLIAIGFTTGGAKTASVSVQNGVWENAWTTDWNSKNLNPMTTDTIQAINTLKVFIRNYASFMVQSGSVGAASWIEGQDNDGSTRWILGFPNDNDNTLTLRNYKGGVLALDAQRIIFPASKGFVRNAQALEYATGAEFGEYLKSEQSAGSAPVNSVWRAFLSVRHRGGNGNLEPGFDSTQWGWALVDNNMTQGNFNEFVLEKTINGTFLTSVRLWHTGNTTVDGNGYLRTASPIVKLFADGSSELNAESEGVVTERIGTGRYRISGCLGLNSDLAWGGVEGGIVGPRCRNGLERLWIDYDVEQDGSIVIRTYHRTHPNAMLFARNELDGYAEGDPIDVPTDTFLSIRVQMPEREEIPYVPVVASKVRHSNVYCNSVSPAK
ncbi:hypothetical protein LES60_06880 [Pectobacterium brasiliense]|uniref:phage tail fiber protein n=1 Tax=Pectobacterium brasiliense TaxID=180957 RepID=UPI001CE1E504|nr:hypothetical protein [Pectobacterium brasiliense]MCA5919238.1 hypothetical protein [Pectobacterium brasiliense]MCA5926375.1 hypothetical protein [Pectobacterium brasiliense]MCA5935609.1 hypothetical protein [Pectobacterium brasiliense]MCA5941540.1 hypothetical protein [Pectobacterium brasiliense]MCA5943222.1 hypothetical protein [Pectobacterium brasiliense]